MTDPDVYTASIKELVDTFRSGLFALLPVAERAQIDYRDEETHRDWERLAVSLFDAFVRSPIDADRSATGNELPLARYDIDLDDFLSVSWLASDASAPHHGAIVRLLSREAPFDSVHLVDIDPVTLLAGPRRTIGFEEVEPFLYRRREDGEAAIVKQIDAVE